MTPTSTLSADLFLYEGAAVSALPEGPAKDGPMGIRLGEPGLAHVAVFINGNDHDYASRIEIVDRMIDVLQDIRAVYLKAATK